ncbi:non-ribosomal peptide synthetase [Cellvibrio mixtus]|uniref:non-ribosomal peptide synthetase n=1 Tax=Cellvibrio mixtus TaxID=39650 RepID=UPI000587541C|nr:non-ribosomal peptide synthetase [Cellvibrio mixtus]
MLNEYQSANNELFPLAHPQQRIWFAEIINPNSGVGNLVGHSEFQEPINSKTLEKAINELVKSADTLRLRIQSTQSDVAQYVADYEPITLQELEFPAEEQFQQHIDRLIRYPFAANNTALYYFELIRVAGKPARLVYCFHHVIMDAASMKITLDAIHDNYRQLARGRNCLPLENQDYREYLKYEARYLSSEKCVHDKKFWAEKLDTYEEPARIKQVNKSVSVQADRIDYNFDQVFNQKIHEFCKREKTSVYRLLMAAYYVYLSRLSGRRDAVIGTVFHNRFNLEFCDKIGMFVSTTPVHLAIAENAFISFRELLSRVDAEVKLAQHHQDYPFDLLIQDRKKNGWDAPLFETAISYQNSSFLFSTEFHFQKAQEFPLVIHLSHRGDNNQLKLELDYQTDYFSRAEVSAICAHLLTIIESAIANPQSDIENLAVLTQGEQEKLMQPGNNNHFIPVHTITELFEQQVAINPDALAVIHDDKPITYKDLDAQANQLASKLQALGVARETIVAILLPRFSELISAMLGVIKTGGAYLPIDADYPQDRVEFMLQDSGATLLVTTAELANNYSSHCNLLLIDKLPTAAHEYQPVKGKPDDLFYVIYTSGSTGRPKGVAVEHGNFENLIYTHRRIYSEGPGVRISQVASVSFDAMAFEVWPCITSGATLYIASDETRLDPVALKEWLLRNKITLSFQSTLMAERLLEEKWPPETALRFLRTAGDKLNRFPSHPLPFAVHNLYGPTEDTVWTTLADVSRPENNDEAPDIGYALDNKHIFILSQRNQLLPQGCIGELCIAGAGLARGYINQPELTAQRFISLQLPTTNNQPLRVYKTGDLARIKENGALEFIGRNDNQVKIRGFRIELGEIEQQLINLSKVQEAVVIPLADKDGSNYLCAYFTATETLSVSRLKKMLARHLPDYMLPAVFLQIDAMPLTRNGKVDRRALPAPQNNTTPTYSQVPMNALELQLCEIWRSLLPVTNIAREDNFFNLGGHSFKAVAMASLIRQQLGREISVKTIFSNPTLGALATELENTGSKTYATIPVATPKKYYLASSAQKRLFALSQLNTGQITYNIPAVYNILGPLNFLKLQDALNQLIQRHESLRTSLTFIDGEVMQTINDNITANIEFFSGTAEQIDHCINHFIRPFDLNQAPLVRLGVFSIDEYQHVLMINVHHAIADGISLSIYLQELAALYEGTRLQPVRLQHKDYSEWELSEHYAAIIHQQREFWSSLLPEDLPLLDLPTDFPRPAKSSHQGKSLHLELTPPLTEKLRAVARQQGYTPYMITLAAFGILLHKYSRQQDLIIGTPAMGRQHPDLQAVTGMLVNTLALRLTPSPDNTLKNYLDQVKQMVIGAVDNQGFLFEELLNQLNPATDNSRSPVFDVFFSLVTEELGQFSLPGTQTTSREFEFPIAKFDLSLTVYERAKGFAITLEYATDLFKPETAQQWLHHYQMVITQLSNCLSDFAEQEAAKTIGELTLVDHNEQQFLLRNFNNTAKEYPLEQTLNSVFEMQAGKTPDNIAAVFADKQLTYKQLNARANQLSRQLLALGVGRDKIVAVLLERSLELPVVLFAILKAGGAYLPIGPSLPQDRIDYMLGDSQAQLVISHSKFSPQLENVNGQLLLIDQCLAHDNLANIDDSNPAAQSGPDDLAYVIYTSGSTGRPKGAMIEHRAVLNRIFWMQDQYPLTEKDVILQKTPYTFDVSVWELFWWSFTGASVYFLAPDAEKDPQAIFDCIETQKISVMHFVPSMLNASLEYLAAGSLPHKLESLRNVFASGEALSPAQVENFNRLVHTNSGAQLINLYGPTEAAIDVTWFDCPVSGPIARVPIGKPISNIQLYILDEQQQLVPRGIAGELYISGTGVGRGYINKPELSNEKFIANPFTKHLRMYRTGDLCRWLDDGNIEYLGRLDHQVKIRGYRIELGEIESRLLSHPRIRDVVVMARQDVQNDNYLCAYVVDRTPEKEPHKLIDELRNYLAQWLPDYMVPAVIQVLDAMPLNPSGKVDRHALPEPDQQSTNTRADYCAPGTALEKHMVQLWETALARSPIGLNDDFFALGGSSLSLIRLLSLITNTFGVSLPIATFFETPILRDIVTIVAAAGANLTHTSIAIPVAAEKTWYKTSASQQRMYILDQFEESSRSYLITALFRIKGTLDIAKLETSFRQLIHLHEALRTRFSVQDDSIVQAIEPDVTFALEQITLQGKSLQERPLEQIINDCLQPLNLACAPLMRASLIEESPDNYCLVIYWHHIIVDGVSINLLLKDLADLYNGQTPDTANITFKDYAEWEQGDEYATLIEDDKKYWLTEFQGEIPALALATDFKRLGQRSFAGDRIKREIPASLMNAAQQFSEQQGYTLFMTLLAALNIVLHKHTQQDEIIIGTPVAGRGLGNCDDICGMFVNTLPLLCPVDSHLTFIHYCEQVKQKVLQGLEHQQYPFDHLVEQLDIARDTSRNPMFDVMFALQNHGEQQLLLEQLETSSLICPLPIAKFDLTVTLFQLTHNILCDFEFCTDLFDPRTIEKLADQYLYTLQTFVTTPELTIEDFHLVATPSAQPVLLPVTSNINNSQPTRLAHQLFEEQTALTPDATALVYQGKEITYAELDEQAERICTRLVASGAGPEKFVGVMLGRRPELIASLLGILKAGAVYLPIDPEYPLERKTYQLQDSRCELLIGQPDSEIPANWDGTFLPIDSIFSDTASVNETATTYKKPRNSLLPITGENAAYCIYTSGSTGTPKGVVIEHRNLVNLIQAQREFYGITAEEKVLFFAAPVFDASLEQIFVALTSGASLLIVDDENIRDHLLMQNIIAEQKITHLNAVPAFLNLLEPKTLPALKRVVCGADICSPELARKWSAHCKFINVYGPTEAAISSTVHSVDANSFTLPSIPIGHPIAQATTYVVDNKLRPVPDGIPGELCIGGAGVARGYLNNPELTREKFIKSPVDSADRWYRTGDLVRRNLRGELEYLGRIDAQVKIRGFRIEPGEIEAVLATYPGIIQAAIAVKNDVHTGQFLCTYYVANQEFSTQHLQDFLASHLPHYMVPGWYLRLAELPVTAGGKINRQLLPVPDRNSAANNNAHLASLNVTEQFTALEQHLLELWKNQLGITTLGIDDNFFLVGGHSITATLICASIQKIYAVKIPLKEFFRLATVRKLANYLSSILDAVVGQQKNNLSSRATDLMLATTRDYYPLSKQQQGIYVLSLFNPGETHYNIPSAYQIRGSLDASRLEQAINSLLHRHNALRSNFTLINGEPVCTIRPYENISLQQKIVALSDHQKIQIHLNEFVKPFDLENDLLFRCLLLRCADDLHILALDVHHIVADGTSFQLLLAELHAAYTGIPLPKVEFQYTDYAVWQTSDGAKQQLELQENYWLEKLTDLPSLDLKADYPRPHVQSFEGDYVEFEWNQEESTQIITFARQLQVTPFTLFCAAFALLLQKYTDQKHILLGTVTAGREEHPLQNIWGMFVNTLVLKLDINNNLSFADYLQAVQTEVLESFAHQQYPFDQLVQKLDVPRDTSRNPIFDVMFTYLVMDTPKNLLGLEEFTPYKTGYSSAKNDLTLNGYELDGKILFNLEYCTRIFSRVRIERMAGHFKNLVRQIISQPNHSLQNLSILGRDEFAQLVHGFNQTVADYPRDQSIAQVFREQALKTPDDLACYYEGHSQTYAELDSSSEQLAQHLHNIFNISPGSIVALLLKRSLRIPQTIFAVLKTGAAYLPLDPDYPDERIREILDNSGASVLLTDDQSLAGHSLNSLTVLNLDRLDAGTNSVRSPTSLPVPGASDPAYIIYTSGSTGKPKGVVINQRGVLNLSEWFNRAHDLQNNRHVLQMTNYCFDVSVEEIIIPLLHGAAIFIPADQIRLDKSQLLDFIRLHHINIAELVPGLLHDYLIESSFIDCLKRVITGAERLDPVLKDAVIAKGYSLFNSYGPTETTVTACGTLCIPGRDVIGKPVANTRIYILDSNNHPTPVGVPGELCIAGDLLASGYLNDAGMTAAKFVENPFEKNGKMYRTGDLCCFLDDGNIEFIGRMDNQVKLRGFRIELGEIESRLISNEHVSNASVLIRKDSNGTRLCAYVTASTDIAEELLRKQLKTQLRNQLPAYMIPEYFLVLDKMPLNRNGKIDKPKLLAMPLHKEPGFSANQILNTTEQQLVELWKKVLPLDYIGVNSIDVNSNFFELGGNSLLIIKLHSLIKDTFAQHIPVAKLFQYASIREFAAYLNPHQIAATGNNNDTAISATQEIAIIGMAGRFPAAKNLEQFWENLKAGRECVSFFSAEELLPLGFEQELLDNPDFVAAKAIIDDANAFDHEFFNYHRRDALLMDPQLRVFHEVVYHGLEHSGNNPFTTQEKIGLFAGASNNPEWQQRVKMHCQSPGEQFAADLVSDKDFLTTRIAYSLNLRGPALNVQTACSTSLVAVDLACQALLTNKCSIAVAGGVSLGYPHKSGYLYQEGMVMSPDGHCRAFDADAHGTTAGEGAGVVVLKRLEAALADGDKIYAVIKGSATNNDGQQKMGFTAPGINGQADVIRSALAAAKIPANSIHYIEAHGTGTVLGDPLEIAALTDAFTESLNRTTANCRIGSVKTNIGHLDAAAGIAGLLKTVLALHHQQLPPSINYTTPNPKIEFEQTPFSVQTRLEDWAPKEYPRRAGVSSFGIGGTNAHIILEEFIEDTATEINQSIADKIHATEESWLIPLAAHSEDAFQRNYENLKHWIIQTNPALADVAATLALVRSNFNWRAALVVNSIAELLDALDETIKPIKVDKSTNTVAITGNSAFTALALKTHWLAGDDIDWESFFSNKYQHKLALPAYAFTREIFELAHYKTATLATAIAPQELNQAANTLQKKPLDQWFYTTGWQSWYSANGSANPANQLILAFVDDSPFTQELLDILKYKGADIIHIQHGDNYRQLDKNHYQVNKNNAQSYRELFKQVLIEKPQQLLYFCGIQKNVVDINQPLDSVINKVNTDIEKALIFAQALAAAEINHPLHLHLIGAELFEVTGDEVINPVALSISGFFSVLAEEIPLLNCNVLDTGNRTGSNNYQQKTIATIIAGDLFNPELPDVVAYRGKQAFSRNIQPLVLAETINTPSNPRIKQRGTYLVTGGLGGIGSTLANYLAGQWQANLILVSRTALPERNLWNSVVANNPAEHKIIRAIELIQQLEQKGSRVLYFAADIGDYAAVQDVIMKSEHAFGEIHGVIHAAGTADGALAAHRTQAQNDAVLQAKIRGTLVLDAAFNHKPLDFMVYCSSLNSLLPQTGQLAYVAANLFQNAVARAQQARRFTLALNWDTWLEVGMAAEYQQFIGRRDGKAASSLPGITPEEGIQVFEHALKVGLPELLISTISLTDYLQQQKHHKEAKQHSFIASQNSDAKPAVANTESLEEQIATIWKEHFNQNDIGLHTDFFSLGDSIDAIQILEQINKTLNIKLASGALMDFPSIQKLTVHIEALHEKSAPKKGTPQLITQLKTANAKARKIFLIHPVGGTTYFYRTLADAFTHDIGIYAIHAQGINDDLAPLTSIEAMVTRYLNDIRQIQPHGPYAIGGASFGGVVAFAMACHLKKAGENVELLFMIDAPNPKTITDVTEEDYEIMAGSLVDNFDDKNQLNEVIRKLQNMSEDQRYEYFGDQLKSRSSTGGIDTDSQYLKTLMAIHQINNSAMLRYVPGVYDGQMVYFRPSQKSLDHLGLQMDVDWQPHVQKPIIAHTIHGNHFTMNEGQGAIMIAHYLEKHLFTASEKNIAAEALE